MNLWFCGLQPVLCDCGQMSLDVYFACCKCRWVVDVTGAAGTLYEGEQFKLQFKFGARYPFDSPQVKCFICFCYVLYFVCSVFIQ